MSESTGQRLRPYPHRHTDACHWQPELGYACYYTPEEREIRRLEARLAAWEKLAAGQGEYLEAKLRTLVLFDSEWRREPEHLTLSRALLLLNDHDRDWLSRYRALKEGAKE